MTGGTETEEVGFIFLFSLNNSGTTVISRYLAQQTGGYLPPFGNNEGHMVPGVFRHMRDAWDDPDRPFDWLFIRAEWSRLGRKAGKPLFIEASPSNFLRAGAILAAFGPTTRAVFSTASPYSFIASVLYNYGNHPLTPQKIKHATRRWCKRARLFRSAMEAHRDIPRISYEGFCADPTILNRALGLDLHPVAEITGKGNERTRGIVDQTRRHLAFLTAEEWDIANAVLSKDRDLVEALGYEIRPGAELIAEAEQDAALFAAGRARRAAWGPRWRRLGLGQVFDRLALRLRAVFTRRP